MNPDIKKKWIEALTSGEYLQGESHLRVGDRFCCLGVLCDIYMKEHPEQAESATAQCQYYSYFGKSELLPEEVVKWAEFEESVIESSEQGFGVLVKHEFGSNGMKYDHLLSGLNDSGYNFESLSKLIEGSL